ncbi:MAG: hypothetical protein AAF907_07535, partial [Planctomycetota bacterium]
MFAPSASLRTRTARGLRIVRCLLIPWVWAAAAFGTLLLLAPRLSHELNDEKPFLEVGTSEWTARDASIVSVRFGVTTDRPDLADANFHDYWINDSKKYDDTAFSWRHIQSICGRPTSEERQLEREWFATAPLWFPPAFAAPGCVLATIALLIWAKPRQTGQPSGRLRTALRSGGQTLRWTLAAVGAGALAMPSGDTFPPFPSGPALIVRGHRGDDAHPGGHCVVVLHWTRRADREDYRLTPGGSAPDDRWRIGYVPPPGNYVNAEGYVPETHL